MKLSALRSAVLWFALAAVCGLVAASSAQAATIYQLGLGNPAVAGFTGPYATVEIDLTSATTADSISWSLLRTTMRALTPNGSAFGSVRRPAAAAD